MSDEALDLSGIFDLEPHGPDTYVGVSPEYPWERVYGGLVVAQALWAATQTVRPEHRVHSLHAYFILGGEIGEPIRYEVDRVRNGRSFTTRRVAARQSTGAILTLACSFQVQEAGPETQSAEFPSDVPPAETLAREWDAGTDCRNVDSPDAQPRSRVWTRLPPDAVASADPRLHACGIAYLSDVNPMGAVFASHPDHVAGDPSWSDDVMGASLDHALWFHRPARADEWVFFDLLGHGLIGSRGLATGPVFCSDGTHVATVAQEGLLRAGRKRPKK